MGFKDVLLLVARPNDVLLSFKAVKCAKGGIWSYLEGQADFVRRLVLAITGTPFGRWELTVCLPSPPDIKHYRNNIVFTPLNPKP